MWVICCCTIRSMEIKLTLIDRAEFHRELILQYLQDKPPILKSEIIEQVSKYDFDTHLSTKAFNELLNTKAIIKKGKGYVRNG